MDYQIWVDYNDRDEIGRVLTLVEYARPDVSVHVGARLLTGDEEGDRCFGVVTGLEENGIVIIELERETFVPAPLPSSLTRSHPERKRSVG